MPSVCLPCSAMSCAAGFYSSGCPKGSVRPAVCYPCPPSTLNGPIVWSGCSYRCADGYYITNGTLCTNATIATPAPPPPPPPPDNTQLILAVMVGMQVVFLGMPGTAIVATVLTLLIRPGILIGKTVFAKALTKVV